MQAITPELEAILKAFFMAGASGFRARIEVDHLVVGDEGGPINTVSYRCDRLDIDKGLRLEADQLEVRIPRTAVSPLGWGADSVFQKNSRIRAYQWYGDVANEVRTFTGLIDLTDDVRDPITVTITARDLMALCIDYTFSAFEPQAADEAGAVRTQANGVFLSIEVSSIVAAILDALGWPADDRVIVPTSYVVDEYIWPDGSSANEALGDLSLLVGYRAFADELGFFHFEPALALSSLTEPPTPAYIFRPGEDLMSLADSEDQYDVRTRVKARGPLTTQVLTDEWRELWRTSKFSKPVGLWHDPSDVGNLRVLDRGTRRLYKLRQSDRVILSSVSVATICPHPLGLSGDPDDDTVYWILNAPWINGGSGGNQAKKVRKSDNHVLLSLDLPDGDISALKVSADWLYFTRLDTDRFYRRNKTTGAGAGSYQHTVGGNLQHNPSGMMIDGTTLHLFWANGGSTARFLLCDESAPGTVTDIVKTAGTALHGGEMDTVSHAHCYGDSDSLGLVAKFSLIAVEDRTDQVYAEVVDTDLEDELGARAQLEPRIHDTHPEDDEHPWYARRDTLDLEVVTSLAQATETAMRRLELLSRFREVLDAGIIGNPALQKTDVFGVVDPVSGLNKLYTIDAYRATMDASGVYVGTIAGVTIPDLVAENGEVDDDGDGTEDDEGSALRYTPVTLPMGDPGPALLWEGDLDTTQDVVVQVWETPTPTGDNMQLRMDAPGGITLDMVVWPKIYVDWTDSITFRFSGSPVDAITAGDNSGDPPAAGLLHVTISVVMEDPAHPGSNPTTFTLYDISVKQGGVEIPTGIGGGGVPPDDPPAGLLQDAIDATTTGGTLDLTGGTYVDAATVDRAMTIVGGTIDGEGTRDVLLEVTADDVVLDGIAFVNSAAGADQSAAVQVTGARFTAQNCTVDGGPYACMRLWPGAYDAQVFNCDFSNGPSVGLLAFQAHGAIVDGCRFHDNTGAVDPGNEAGGTKFGESEDIVIRNCQADANVGPGIWADAYCSGVVITGNDVHDNTRSGIHVEITDGYTVTYNTVYRNCTEDSLNRFVMDGILISSCRNGTVTGNTAAWNNPASPDSPAPADIAFISQNRVPLPHDGNVATGNVLRSSGTSIVADDDWADTGGSNVISPNTLVGDSDSRIVDLA